MNIKYFAVGIFLYIFTVIILIYIPLKSKCYNITINSIGKKENIIRIVVMALLLTICIMPMGMSPAYNGKHPGHRDQYIRMADALLDGNLYIDRETVDEKLLMMENPYDPVARDEIGAKYEWDHAFYNGHYYMYFGIVPTIIMFLPFKIITGEALMTYHATQIFVVGIIVGFFVLFDKLSRFFFPHLKFGIYMMLATSISLMSVWYSVAAPEMYCTAITGGICFELWSIIFFTIGLWGEENENRQLGYAILGALCGALVFGCRPTIGIANILLIPWFLKYVRGGQISFSLCVKNILKIVFVASSYIIVGSLLMLYNYVRFDNPFEFGQAYQLTVADQHMYGSFFESFDLKIQMEGIVKSFFEIKPFEKKFPYISFAGVFINFPMLLWSFTIFKHKIYLKMKEKDLLFFSITLLLAPLIITIMTIHWSPYLIERYHMDVYFLMGISCFIGIGFGLDTISDKAKKVVEILAYFGTIMTIMSSILLYFVPYGNNVADCYPELLEKVDRVIKLGIR